MDLGQVFTGDVVAKYMASQFSCREDSRILEPCFGGGAFLKACKERGYVYVEGCEIDVDLFDMTKKQYPDYRLFCEDFLSFTPEYKYDGIIMNPPYVRQEKINDLKDLGITKEFLRKNPIYAGLPSTANLYMYFLLKAIDLLCDGGELVVIFPSSWMKAKSGIDFNNLLYSKTSLIKEVYVNGDVFEKDALVDVVILKLVKKLDMSCKPESVYMELQEGKLIEKNIHLYEMKLTLDKPFCAYSNIRRGLTTGWNTMFINPTVSADVDRAYIRKIISTPKSVSGYNTDTAATDKLLMITPGELLEAELIQYIKGFEERLLREKKPKALYEKTKKSNEWYTLNSIDSDGILFSYFVRNDMKFVMNTANMMARDNFYIIYPRINKYLMFALLNNYYTYFQLESIGKKYGGGLLKLQRYDIENLKFIDVDDLAADDEASLIALAKDLIEKSNADNIIKITEILAHYAGIDFEVICREYEEIKKKRLEAS